jgi:hypothetical protein
MANQLLQHGFTLSYGAKFNAKSVEITPLQQLCIETDNKDVAIETIYQQIASLKNCSTSQLNAASLILKINFL